MLDNTLQSICVKTEKNASVTRFHCKIDDDFYGFNGHFKEQPVMPGVCQLRLAVEAVAQIFGAPEITCFEKVKFHNLIVPGTSFVLEIEALLSQWRYRLYNEESEFASGKIISK